MASERPSWQANTAICSLLELVKVVSSDIRYLSSCVVVQSTVINTDILKPAFHPQTTKWQKVHFSLKHIKQISHHFYHVQIIYQIHLTFIQFKNCLQVKKLNHNTSQLSYLANRTIINACKTYRHNEMS